MIIDMSHKVELITDAKCIVGEGPLWDGENQSLYMVDIHGKRLRKIQWDSFQITDMILPQQTGFVVKGDDGALYAGAEDGIYRIDHNGGFSLFSKPIFLKGERFNDGKVGADGRLYAGTYSRDYSAAFYRMEYDGTLIELFDKVGNSNGLDWSPDGKILYYNDTPTKRTDCFRFCEGELQDRTCMITYSCGNPDGMTVDTDGNIWTALWGEGSVVCVNPKSGAVIDKITLPVSQPSSCAFAGSDRKTLVITTAAHGVSLRDEPLAGSLFAVRMDVPGLETNLLKVGRRGDIL